MQLETPMVEMLGRWQPWHDGHTALFKKARETAMVCIMVRTMPKDEKNPFDFHEVRGRICKALGKEGFKYAHDYIIMQVPNIIDISYGRDVGYTITKHEFDKSITDISATKIREQYARRTYTEPQS